MPAVSWFKNRLQFSAFSNEETANSTRHKLKPRYVGALRAFLFVLPIINTLHGTLLLVAPHLTRLFIEIYVNVLGYKIRLP